MKLNLKIVAAAAAVAMMGTGVAQAAADVGVTPAGTYYYSKEGLTLTGTGAVALPDIYITLGNNLTQNDDIYITLPGTVSIPSGAGVVSCLLGGSAIGYIGTVSGGWNFRVTAVGGVVLGDTCTFTGLAVQGGSLANSTGTLNYEARRFLTGQLVDSASSSTSIVVKSQFAISTQQKLNGVIDVYKDRLAFTDDETVAPGDGASPADQADTLNFSTVVDGDVTFTGPVVTTTQQLVTIADDFNWTDSNGNGTCTTAELAAGISGYAGWSVDGTSTCSQLVLTSASAVDTANQGYFFVPGDVILDPVDWTGAVTFSYSLGAVSGTTSLTWDPGVWTINGAQVYIQYMPYGDNIGRIIYAANRGPINATATADVWYEGTKFKCDIGAVNANTVNKLSTVIDTCIISAHGITSGKVAILLTFTAPDKDIEVYSAYNVDGNDRGTVVNTSNGRSFYYGLGL